MTALITADEIRREAQQFTGSQRSAIRRARREAMVGVLAAPNAAAKDTAYRLWKTERWKLSEKYGVVTETIEFIATGHLPADKDTLPPTGTWTPQPKKQRKKNRPAPPGAPAVDVNVWPLPPTSPVTATKKQPATQPKKAKPKKTYKRCPVCCKMAPAARSKFLAHKVKGGASCPGAGTSTKGALVVPLRVVGGGLPGMGKR